MNWFNTLRAFVRATYEIREREVGGVASFCIYRQRFGRLVLLEQWGTLRAASVRLAELSGEARYGALVTAERAAAAMPSHQRVVDLGEDARRVLENPAFNEALRLMAEDAVDRMKACPIRDQEGLLLLAQGARLTDKVAETLRGMLEAGKMASAQIDIDSARNESRSKRALRKVA